MKRLIRLNSGLLTFILLGFFLEGHVFAAAGSMPLAFKSQLTKYTYLLGEPVIIRFTLTNKTQETITVAEPLVREGFLKILLTTAEGKKVDAPRLVWDVALPPQDYGNRLGPEQSFELTWSLNESYPYGLKPGSYQVLAIYDTAKHATNYPKIWHGTITGPKMVFNVTDPTKTEKNAYYLLKGSRDILLKREKFRYNESRKMLLDLVARYPQSVYVPYAYYLLGKTYFVKQADKKQHFAEAAREFQTFLKKFPEYPYYSDIVRVAELPYSLLQTGQGGRAKEILRTAPDGLYKQRMLRQIEKTNSK